MKIISPIIKNVHVENPHITYIFGCYEYEKEMIGRIILCY